MDNKEVKRARINIYLVQELKDYVDEEAKRFGLSTSSFMTMLIQNYKMQNTALSSVNDINGLIALVNVLNSNSKLLGSKEESK